MYVTDLWKKNLQLKYGRTRDKNVCVCIGDVYREKFSELLLLLLLQLFNHKNT